MKKEQLEYHRDQFGKWTAHKIKLISDEGEIVYTKPGEGNGNRELMNRICQVIEDTIGDVKDLTFMDLACLEGLHGINLACMGARQVNFLEARKQSVDKTLFAINALNLKNSLIWHEDMRLLSPERHGTYDVVLCLGCIYHFRVPEVFEVIKKVRDIAVKAVIFDAVFASEAEMVDYAMYEGNEYKGHIWDEDFQFNGLWGPFDATLNEHDIIKSWKFSFDSFVKYLSDIGFSSVYDVCVPMINNRRTVLAVKGRRVRESLPMI